MAATVKIKELPTLAFVNDYHDFGHMESDFGLIGLSLKAEEIGFDDNRGQYVGIVYSGRMPSKAKIAALVKKYQVEFMD